ncbi:hypothetical protein V1387_01895 [Allomuricauda taeanensis]|uniref:hypothetical protein n=1 Tax=Flagellimonas taeanensis TaxID=1005926 RepID=UPI002E7C0FB9|nr:hypothetical protein [Allomuricauda taeanensis]MEE1961420.1 hypothetical protein [Allomuricauda taeanensis]
MRKIFALIFLNISTFSCSDNSKSEHQITELESLRAENDSLKKIVAEISEKYVFDSISVRDIPSYQNKYELNSKITGEILFVGYNLNDKSWAIKFDSINYKNGRKLINPDTLKNIKGGYQYEKILDSDFNTIRADLRTENDYGKPFNLVYHTAIRIKN